MRKPVAKGGSQLGRSRPSAKPTEPAVESVVHEAADNAEMDVTAAELPEAAKPLANPSLSVAETTVTVPEGDLPEGDLPEGDLPEGDLSEGDLSEADFPAGDVPDDQAAAGAATASSPVESKAALPVGSAAPADEAVMPATPPEAVVMSTTPSAAEAGAEMSKAGSSAAVAVHETARINTGVEKVMKSTEDLFAFGQGNIEAMVKAGQIWTTGLQDLTKQVAAGAQANLDETMTAFKALSGAKTLKDAIDLQTGFARTAFEKSMAESGKLTDASLKLAEQALAPITARVTAAMDSFGKAA